MNFLAIATQTKSRTETKISYYYDVNVGHIEEETAGILVVDLEYFDELPDQINDYSMHVLKNMISKKIIVEKPCSTPELTEDGDDFMEKFGFVPEKCALVICGNSQNSKSEALAEIDYIGFFKEVNKKKD